ncbi:hypothetical protein RG963_14315 [Methanosarcina sp. Z-7115]|uniref:Cell surface protein n=1 Tax=Methanosarcina baikalica TaxID=3073890 RepID=A0ABU2D4R9_9EURY|nr:hypothetical protein [Methanosarcina sp. Z-7115]MDR7666932.1 hypothetical protein [Methanosarcina sp. Z-7115]
MNIKASLMIALIACVMLVGVAAANQENPEAGNTWARAALFNLGPGYNSVSGSLSSGDTADYWRETNAACDVEVMLYLDPTSLSRGGVAQMYEGNSGHSFMQRVQQGNNACPDTHLDVAPVYVTMTPAGLGDYTFTVRRY